MFVFLALVLLANFQVEAYSVNDILQKCAACAHDKRIPNPTDCTQYYYCNYGKWSPAGCSASTGFNYDTTRCVHLRDFPCSDKLQEYETKDIYEFPECADQRPEPTTTQPPEPPIQPGGTDRMDQETITIILASSLGAVIFLIILAVVIFFICRRYKSNQRPRSIYSSIPGQKANKKNQKGGANNDLYMKRSLIKQKQKTQEEIYSTVRDDQEANMDSGIDESETDDRNKPYYSLPPNRRRPRIPVSSATLPPAPPVPNVPTASPYADHAVQYARTDSNEESATYMPIDENPSYQPINEDPNYSSIGYQPPQLDGGYECPQAADNHTYEVARPDSQCVPPEGEADYKSRKGLNVPAVAPRPVETLRRADQTLPATPNTENAPQPPARGASHQHDNTEQNADNSESQPYYIVPVTDEDVQEALIQPLHNYHILEQPK